MLNQKKMETLILKFSDYDSYESFAKGFGKFNDESESWKLYLSERDCETQTQLKVFEFIKKNLIESGPGFFYTGPDLACGLLNISEANFESQPQFFEALMDMRAEVSDMLSEEYKVRIRSQVFGGRFGKYINFYTDLDEITFIELAGFLEVNTHYSENMFESVYYYVTESPGYFEKFRELIEWVVPGCGKYAGEILKCDLNYIDTFESELLKLVRKKDKATIKKNIKDIYYYASHY